MYLFHCLFPYRPCPTFEPVAPQGEDDAHVPAHKDFREKYFQGFKPSKMEESKDEYQP
ncbi:hypothetical protein B0H34DRAFT_697611 [Crassisporium funariophilum]|nr:hypothetical protein B0H34DRAFT_697611 [Crassisporium funariophilum]